MRDLDSQEITRSDEATHMKVSGGNSRRRRPWRLLGGVLAVVALLFGLGLRFAQPPKAPLAAGKPLDDWLRELAGGTATRHEAARNVLLTAGPDHLRWLVDTLERKPSLAGKLLLQTDDWLPGNLKAGLHRRVRPHETALNRAGAALAMGLLEVTNGKVINALDEALRSPDPRLARAAASSLGQLGPAGTIRLLTALPDLSGMPRFAALAAIHPSNTTATAAVPVILAEALREPNARNLPNYSHAVAAFGGDAVPPLYAALPGRAMKDTQRLIHLASVVAATSYAFLREWDQLWETQSPETRLAGIQVLRRVPNHAVRRAMLFARGVCDPDPRVREVGLEALITVREHAGRTIPLLLAGLESESTDIQLAATGALGQLGPLAGTARAALLGLVNASDSDLRQAAQEALALIDSPVPVQAP
jgi:hypothetical protein